MPRLALWMWKIHEQDSAGPDDTVPQRKLLIWVVNVFQAVRTEHS